MTEVLYLNHASEDLYALFRAEAPDGVTLVTLESDDEAERLERLATADVVIVGSTRLTAAHVAAAPRLRLVHHQGVGYHDTCDVDALRERQIALALAPGGTSVAVSEQAVMLMLAANRHLAHLDAELRAGRWHANTMRMRSRQLAGQTVGIVGLGRIGRAVARRLVPFGVRVLYNDILDFPESLDRELNVTPVDFDTLLAEAETITLHLPLTEESHHMFDAGAFARMREGAVLVNCARGPIVEEAALVAALTDGPLRAAGLDTFELEPPPGDWPLARLPNVVLTPHVAAGVREAMAMKIRDIFANIARFEAGESLEERVVL